MIRFTCICVSVSTPWRSATAARLHANFAPPPPFYPQCHTVTPHHLVVGAELVCLVYNLRRFMRRPYRRGAALQNRTPSRQRHEAFEDYMSPEFRLQIIVTMIFLASAIATVAFVIAMPGGMAMPGGWEMSMMWMLMPNQTWLSAAALFVAMWAAMMVTMMLPSTLPLLELFQRTLRFRGGARVGQLTAWLGVGYLSAWLAFGGLAYATGVAIGNIAMASAPISRLVPVAAGAALLLAGVYQFTPWKRACLTRCRNPVSILSRHLSTSRRGALRLGLIHGGFCVGCCWGLMLMQLVLGIMSLVAMVLVASVIAAEKLLPHGETIAKITGAVAIVAGIATMAMASGIL